MLDAAAAAGMNIDAKNPEELVQRLMSAIVDGGHAPILLGGMLLPADVPDRKWRPRLAAATAEFMEELTDPEDKQLALILVAELIIDFFEGARALLGYFADVFRSVENLGVREPIAATS
jgi:hypothetical protein